MNTTTNTRGVSEAMVGVSAECYIGDKELKMLRDPDVGVCFVSRAKSDRANTPLFTLAALEAALPAEPAAQGEGDFKNFHRLLCERFGYVHDEKDWRRDQLSLIEHIAKHTHQEKP